MNQDASDQGWQELQAHIEGFFHQASTNDLQKIEYKPRYIALLEMASGQQENNAQETNF